MSRTPVPDQKYCLRRIGYWSSHWRPPSPTSGAFSDRSGELSIDIWDKDPTSDIDKIKSHFSNFIEKGHGVSYSQVQDVKSAFQLKNISGEVLNDPLDNDPSTNRPNPLHGIITGKDTENKKKTLRDCFNLLLSPKNPLP